VSKGNAKAAAILAWLEVQARLIAFAQLTGQIKPRPVPWLLVVKKGSNRCA
jgi:hypothetical protein